MPVVGHPSYILAQLEQKADEHKELLLYCAAPRANYLLRTVQPEFTASFAKRHDKDFWTCLCDILQIDGARSNVVSSASLPPSLGGVGLASACRIREAANWASWADCLEMVRNRHPSIATAMIESPRGRKGAWGRLHHRSTRKGWNGDFLLERTVKGGTTRPQVATRTRPDRAPAWVAKNGVHFGPRAPPNKHKSSHRVARSLPYR